MRFGLLSIIFLIAASMFSSCDNKVSQQRKPVLTVSIDPQRKMLEELSGDNFEIVSIIPSGANPETFEPTVSQRMKAAQSKAFFPIGYFPFENNLISEMNGRGYVYNTTNGITPLMGTHSHGDHEHHEADPHLWTSFKNGKTIASNMASALISIDPDNANLYNSRLQTMLARLDSLDNAAEQLTAQAHAFAVWHPSLSYFARDYDLEQIAVGQESKEMSLNSLKKIINEAKADSVKVFFFQKEYDSRQAENLNQEIGSRLVSINPLDYDWENELMRIAYELSK